MISIPATALVMMADALALTFKEQIQAGLDEHGNSFPLGVDLVRTGLLLASIKGEVVNGEPSISIGVPYAPIVLTRYQSTSLCPQYQQILEQRWQAILATSAAWVE